MPVKNMPVKNMPVKNMPVKNIGFFSDFAFFKFKLDLVQTPFLIKVNINALSRGQRFVELPYISSNNILMFFRNYMTITLMFTNVLT